ncbi:MAG: hypothetical protein HQ568_02980 [Calditrichaeota bacterium]|nr:hypothetical protein [Calditrichota bacterium]
MTKKAALILIAALLAFNAIYAQSPNKESSPASTTESVTDSTASKQKIALGNWRFIYPYRIAFGRESTNSMGGFGYLTILLELWSMSYSFQSLKDVGIGTSIIEIPALGFTEHDPSVGSLLPVYAYYPLYTSNPKKLHPKYDNVRSPFVYLFVGGSKWGFGEDYFHLGVNAIFYTLNYKGSLWNYFIPLWNYSIQSGIILASEVAGNDRNAAFYIAFQFGIGGVFD